MLGARRPNALLALAETASLASGSLAPDTSASDSFSAPPAPFA